jgi:superfamily II DNA or RNA helicase
MSTTRVQIDSRIRVQTAGLSEETLVRLRRAFTHDNPAHDPGGRSDEPPTIRTYREGAGEMSLPRGGLARARAILEPGFQVDDRRAWRHPSPGFPDHRATLRPYQRRMVDAAVDAETCLLRAPTGAGKTTGAIGLMALLKRRSLVVVWEGGLERQWRERVAAELGIAEADVGTVRGNKELLGDVTVAMQQTLVGRFRRGDRSLCGAFDVVVADEVQRFSAPTLVETIDPFEARYRVGVSADHTRRDGKEFLTEDLFGAVACAVPQEELLASGAIVDVEMLVVPTNFKAGWYRYRQDFNRLLAQMTADEDRNALLLEVARRTVGQGHQVLIFTHRVGHARELDSRLTSMGIKSGTMLGGVDNKASYEVARDSIRAGGARVGIGTFGAIAQGIDLPTVSRGIVATPCFNNRQLIGQIRGRLCRPSGGKGVAKLICLVDVGIYGARPVKNFLEWFGATKVLVDGKWIDGDEWLESGRRR